MANHVRLKKIVYPTTTKFLEPLYGTGSGQDDVLSRFKQLLFAQSGAVVLADNSYLGLDQFRTCLMNLKVLGTNGVPEAGGDGGFRCGME